MVRIVYRNIFYEMGWGISDEKKELWTKSKNLEGSEFWKINFEVQNWVFEGFVKDKFTLKMRYHPPPFWLNFHINLYYFPRFLLISFCQNQKHIRKIPNFYPRIGVPIGNLSQWHDILQSQRDGGPENWRHRPGLRQKIHCGKKARGKQRERWRDNTW